MQLRSKFSAKVNYNGSNINRRVELQIYVVGKSALSSDRKSLCMAEHSGFSNSNKLTNQMQQFHKFITWRPCVAQHVSGASTPIIRSLTTALKASGFTLERGGSSVVGRGLAGQTTTNDAATTTFQG
jgi:hypothetical protein